MLEITVPGDEGWDSEKEEFVTITPAVNLRLEHSLLSLAKWESKWHKPFLSTERTAAENLDYVRCMTLNQHVDPSVYMRLSRENMTAIYKYINDDATATKFYDLRKDSDGHKNKKRKLSSRKTNIQTSETIYAAMFECGIPIDFEKRHLNHLLTLIRVCQERQNPSKAMSKQDRLAWQRAQNARRKSKLGTKG